tara:strand:- start:12441 stop:13142 length:702 start_codon:yes stop_codon:yes gene_type:complete
MTFSELVTKIRNYTEVDSSVLTDAIVDDMIRDAELRIFREVDADYAREYATANLNINSPYIELPNATSSSGLTSTRRAIIVRSFLVFNTNESPTKKEYLDKRDTSFIFEFNSTGETGVPKYYANWKETTIIMAPTPDAQYKVQLSYVYTPDHLSSTNPNTYLSDNVPDLLFYATMMQAYEFLKGPMDMYKLYSDKYNVAIQSFALEQMGRRRRDEYMDGVPRVQIPAPSPNSK